MHMGPHSRSIGDAVLPRTYHAQHDRTSHSSFRSSILDFYDLDDAGPSRNTCHSCRGRFSTVSLQSSTLDDHRGGNGGEAGTIRSHQPNQTSYYAFNNRSPVSPVSEYYSNNIETGEFQNHRTSQASFYDSRSRSRSRSRARSSSSNHNGDMHSTSSLEKATTETIKGPKPILSLRAILFEISSLVCAAISLIVLIAVLRIYDDKPATDWTFAVTLNAILSIASNIFRGSLLIPVATGLSQFGWLWYVNPRPLRDVCDYDSASRGPLGSLRLLWTLRFRHVAAVGAVITLLAISLDPFFQQSVSYETRPAVDSEQKAYTVAAQTWSASGQFRAGLAATRHDVPFDMQLAISSGLRSGNTLAFPDPPHNCPSGNCTWDPYATLALNTRCVDITSHLKLSCTSRDYVGDYCSMKSAGDPMLHDLLNASREIDSFSMQCSTFPESMDAGMLEPYRNLTGFLTICQWAKATNVDPSLFIIRPTSTVEAGRCVFYLAVNEMKSEVNNGHYSEKKLQEFHFLEQNDPTKKPSANAKDNQPYKIQQVGSAAPQYRQSSVAAHAKITGNNTFSLPYNAWLALSMNFNGGFLNGKVNLAAWDKTSSPLRRILYQSDNVTRAMDGIAEYVTIAIRANTTNQLQQKHRNGTIFAPEEAIAGSVWIQKQFIAVQWAWLTLPIVLLALTILFLAAAYFESRRLHVGLWQSSPLALFFHSRIRDGEVARTIEENYLALSTEDEMRDAAAGLYAKIPERERGTIEVYAKAGDERRYSDPDNPG